MAELTVNAPVLNMTLTGGLANKMIEFMFAASLKQLVPNLIISNIDIPEWSIFFPEVIPEAKPLVLPDEMRIDVRSLATKILSQQTSHVAYSWYGQHMDNFSTDKAFLSSLFQPNHEDGFGPTEIVINIRGQEILDARHPDYVLIPISFYERIVSITGLKPVFFGQIERNGYIDALTKAFPDANFIASKGAVQDFNILRNSHNIIPAISTFSWLAAWLSNARVHLPVLGLFNPFQQKSVMLLPLDDPNYRFYLFPILYSVEVKKVIASHRTIDQRWEATSAEVLRERLRDQPMFQADLDDHLASFDATYYLEEYRDVQEAFGGDVSKARRHFAENGYGEGRKAFAFDEKRYLARYADAASAVGRGEFESGYVHYVMIGRTNGYTPS